MIDNMNVVICGLSITSSWGNGHATNYRGLVQALTQRGHDVTFLERDVPWYAAHRDLPEPPFGRTLLYGSLDELFERHEATVSKADLVIVGSYVPDGVEVGRWVTSRADGVCAFYDIDTPVTLAKLARGEHEYLTPNLIPAYDLYLSFTGGPTLERLEAEFGSPRARAFYCIADPETLYPESPQPRWDLGYLGTYSDDRQPTVQRLLVDVATASAEGAFVVAGPQYPDDTAWPPNVERIDHLPPARHRAFYNSQRFTLNVTRADMIRAGYSPSVRLFEAAACGVPVISDRWDGLDEFFQIGSEILVADSTQDVLGYLSEISVEEARAMGERARKRVLAEHTAQHRVRQLEGYVGEVRSNPSPGKTGAMA